jgi:uncharacterized RDD family membrane protein YckC
MKKLKITTIWLVLAFIIVENILRIPYYKLVFKGGFSFYGDYSSILTIIHTALSFLMDIFSLVLGIMALENSNKEVQDRTYSIFRFMYVMGSLLSIPLFIYQTVYYAKYWFATPATTFTILFQHLVGLTLLIFLIICKPERQLQKVNLQEYDTVAFTSIGHRFVHYLLDVLFLLPIWLVIINYLFMREPNRLILQLLFTTSYFLYCFLSEAIFRQTIGKMVTRSCVVSNGVDLSTGRVFLRTLSRLIPFDGISFLFGAKWHDRASSTAVVYIDSWEIAFEEKQQGAEA